MKTNKINNLDYIPELPSGYSIVTDENYIVRTGDKLHNPNFSYSRWGGAINNGKTIKQKNASRLERGNKPAVYATNKPLPYILSPLKIIVESKIQKEPKIKKQTIPTIDGDKAIPTGFKLIKENSDEIIADRAMLFRKGWPDYYVFEYAEASYKKSIGLTPKEANKNLSKNMQCFFLNPVARFKCNKPFPFGY